jgi:hypothetical protein
MLNLLIGTYQNALEVPLLFGPHDSQDFDQVFLSLINHSKWSMYNFPKGGIVKLGHHPPGIRKRPQAANGAMDGPRQSVGSIPVVAGNVIQCAFKFPDRGT